MYNEDIKMEFCREVKSTQKSIAWAFARTEPYEVEAGKDVAEMGKNECIYTIGKIGLTEFGTVKSTISTLRLYSKWCKENNIFPDVSDGIFEISPEDIRLIEPLGQSLFRDDVELVESIKKVIPIDAGYIEYPVFCLNWIGLNNSEIVALKDNDVDLDDRIIYGQDGSIVASGFSDNICDTLKRYCECRCSVRPRGVGTAQAVKDMSVDLFLKRMVLVGSGESGKGYSLAAVNNQCSRMAKKYQALGYPHRHTYQNVWRSGRYYELHKIEQSGVDIFDRANQPVIEGVFRHKKNYFDILKMYSFYKKAFSLE